MISILLAALAGGLAGIIHVLSGPDHLVAVGVFASRGRNGSWKSGLLWGVGHAVGAGAIATLALLLRDALPLDVEWLSSWGERFVGITLLVLGFLSLGRKYPIERHHGAAIGIGILHGVSGVTHLLSLLPALLLPGRASALSYIGGFAGGTIMAMIGFAAVVGLSGVKFRVVCSFASIIVGCFWIWSAF